MSESRYWATLDAPRLLDELNNKVDLYYNFINQSLMPLWRQSFYNYNYAAFSKGRLQVTGTNNEYVRLGANHYRSLIDHSVVMAINQRPAWEPRATNSDSVSQKQTILARGLLDYYMREKHLERKLKQALEFASLYGEGFILVEWNATSGEAYGQDPDSGIIQYQGDVEYSVYGPIDVIRSSGLYAAADCEWRIIREFKNKWNLIAKYGDDPEVRAALEAATLPKDPKRMLWQGITTQYQDDDLIEVYKFYHDRTEAVPDGRYTYFTKDVVLSDGPLPSRKNSVFRVAPGELNCTGFGYTSNYDILSIQEMINVLMSSISSNQAAFGVQNIATPRGANTTIVEVRDGMNLIEYDASLGKPEALNLTQTAPELFQFVQYLEKTMETLSGVNSVARGNPESSLKSGAALALVQSMAVQFMMGLQASYVQLLEDVGSSTIDFLREYASVPRMAMIAGKSKRGMMMSFSSEDLSNVNRVQVDAGNAMAKTAAGKIELATMLIENKLITTPEELLMVIETGNLEPLTEGPTNELLSIKKENEELSDGKPMKVLVTDNHRLHIQEHKCVLSDPAVRDDDEASQAALEHIMEHMNMLMDPVNVQLLQLIGQEPIAPPQGGLEQLGNAAGGVAEEAQGANTLAEQMQPNLPNAPMIAGTDQRAQLPEGAAIQQ